MVTVAEMLRQAQLDIAHSPSARLDAEVLLCEVMQCDRGQIYSHPERSLAGQQVALFQSLIQSRQRGTPVAYITGKKEFWSLELSVSEDTLVPRPETECLVEAALQMIPEDTAFNLLDIGTGSGAIALAIGSERPYCNILATDISPNTLAIAEQNVARHQLHNVRFLLSDWYQEVPPVLFDMIVSNPPYIRQDDEHLLQGDIRFEPELALLGGIDGMQSIRQIISKARGHLVDGAYLFIEHGADQGGLVRDTLLQHDFRKIKTIRDLSGQDRISYGV